MKIWHWITYEDLISRKTKPIKLSAVTFWVKYLIIEQVINFLMYFKNYFKSAFEKI